MPRQARFALSVLALETLLSTALPMAARATQGTFSATAPAAQYLMSDAKAEIALARSAAPAPISRDATILVLTLHGYETAVKGSNGFVCIVERSWMSPFD